MKKDRKLPLLTGLGVAACMSLGIVALSFAQDPVVKRPMPNILADGNVAESTRIFEELHAVLKARNWNAEGMSWLKYRLPDQDLAESEASRDPRTIEIITPDSKEIAFYTEIYIRWNFRRIGKLGNETFPEGFYLVCWRDGRIQRVPVERARMLARRTIDRETHYDVMFPGQPEYRDSLPMVPNWAMARNKPVPLP